MMTTPNRPRDGERSPARSESTTLPLPFTPLPFDDEADVPVAFRLTARARRVVAPDVLPPLRVIDGEPSGDSSGDTRPARARALRRAGVATAEIARQLAVDPLLVDAWTGEVPVGRSVRPRRVSAGRVVAPVVDDEAGGPSVLRRRARDDAARALGAAADSSPSGAFFVGLGLMAGLASVDPHGVSVMTTDPWRGARAVQWTATVAPSAPRDVRVVLRIGPSVAADLARQTWAHVLAIDRSRVTVTRWRHAPDPEDVAATIRLGGSDLAAVVAGWIDVLRASGDASARIAE